MTNSWSMMLPGALTALLLGCSGTMTADGGDSGASDAAIDRDALDGGADAGHTTDAGSDAGRGSRDAGSGDAGCLQLALSDGGCSPLSFANICQITQVTVLQTAITLDTEAAARMGAAFAANCNPAPALRTVNADDGGILDEIGAPLVGRTDTLVAAGGNYTQRYVGWLERSGGSPVLDTTADNLASFSTRSGERLFTEPLANLTAHFDYFVLEFIRSDPFAPISIIGYGFYAPGTTAASWYFEHRVMPARSNWPGAWYVIRWTDTDGDSKPSEADEFAVLRSGN